MSIRTQSALDVAVNIEIDGDPVTFIDPDDAEYPIDAQILQVDARIDPLTNQQVNEPRTAVSVALASIEAVGILPVRGWRMRFDTLRGETIVRMIVGSAREDNTIGYVTFVAEQFETLDSGETP